MKQRKNRKHLVTTLLYLLVITLSALATSKIVAAWSTDTRLTTSAEWDREPSIMQTRNGSIWVAWASDKYYGQYDIFYKTSPNYGSTWSSPVRFTRPLSIDDTPRLMQTQNESIWLIWVSDRTGNPELLYQTSPDYGQTWDPIVELTNYSNTDGAPSITQNTDGTIWVAWHRNVTGNFDIYYKTTSNFGSTWSDETPLTTNSSADLRPSITHTHNGTIWVVWTSSRTDDYELFYKTSSDNGSNWSDEFRLTTDLAWDISPSVLQAVDGSMWVFWASDRKAGQNEVFYKTSSDFGLNWTTDTQLTANSNDDENPAAVNTADRKIWVVWHSTRDLNYEIYYKISDPITSVHDVALTKMTVWMYPNIIVQWGPRGVPIYINLTVENQGDFTETFNVSAYADRVPNDVHIDIDTQNLTLAGGTTTTVMLTWNTTETPSGSYYISAEATILPNEYDIDDNTMLREGYIGGIFDPWKPPPVDLLAKLSPWALSILIMVALGLVAIAFFKLQMSIRPRWPRLPLKVSRDIAEDYKTVSKM